MVKVALINPGTRSASDSPPIGLGVLGAILEKKGYSVKIIDRLSGQDLSAVLNGYKPDIVGIGGTTQVINDAYRIADYCRSLGLYVVMGGIHSTLYPEESLKHSDAVITGEAEKTIVEVISKRAKGVFAGDPYLNLDEVPMPAYHLLNMEYYTGLLQRVSMSFAAIAPRWFKLGCILTSRGCPWNCTFCYNSFRTLPWRANSPYKVIDEIQFLIDNYETNAIFFVEDNLFSNHDRLKKICKLMKESKMDIVWGANARVDCVNEDILKTVKDANCKQVTFGWESGSQRVLDMLNKRTKVEFNYKSVELCNKVGVNASGTVMVGNPNETLEDIALTEKFLKESYITGGIGICITTPYPGTKIWEWCKENNRVPFNFNWDDFDFHHVPIRMTDIPYDVFMNRVNELIQYAINTFREREQDRMTR